MFFDNFEEKINNFIKKQPSEIKKAIRDIEAIFYTENLSFEDDRTIKLLSKNSLIKKDEYGVTLELENNVTLKYYWGDNSYFEKLYIFDNFQDFDLSFFVFCEIPDKKETIIEINFPIKQFGKTEILNYNVEKKELDYDKDSIEDYNEYKFIIDNFENPDLNDVLSLFFDVKLKEKENLIIFYNVLNSFKKIINNDNLNNITKKTNSI